MQPEKLFSAKLKNAKLKKRQHAYASPSVFRLLISQFFFVQTTSCKWYKFREEDCAIFIRKVDEREII